MADQFVASGTSAATIQGYITAAVRGDTITFEAGATFDTASGFTLPVKAGTNDGTDANSVILRSQNLSSLPSGSRVKPSQTANMARLRASDTAPIFTADSGAGGYKILGLELTNVKSSPPDWYVVNLLIDATVLGAHLTVDRCFLHPQEYPNDTAPYYTTGRFAIAVNGTNVNVTNCYFGGFFGIYHGSSNSPVDTVGISVGQIDTFLIDNNYIEAWYNPIFLGGSDTTATSSATISSATLTSATLSNTTGLSEGDIIALELPADTISTTLSAGIDNAVTTIPMTSTVGWDNAAYAVIEVGGGFQEHIRYTSKDASSLMGVTRGVDGSNPLAHSGGASIKLSYCKRGNTNTCWGNGIVQSIAGNDITFTSLIGTNYSGLFAMPIPASITPSGQAVWDGKRIDNVTITHNHIHLPTAFAQWTRSNFGGNNGNHPKGYMEIKAIENSLIEGNYLEGYFATIGFNGVNQSGGSPWLQVYNVTLRNNWVKGTRSLCFLVFDEQYYMCTNGGTITVTNNLVTDPDVDAEAGDIPSFISQGSGGDDLTFTHNTFYGGDGYTQNWASWGTLVSPRNIPANVTFKDNIIANGNYGFGCGTGGGTAGCWTVTEDQNLFVLNVNPPNQNPVTDQGFTNSLTAADNATVKWTNAGGSTLNDWVLAADSPYRSGAANQASDGTDIGVNITTLRNALGTDNLADIGEEGGPPASNVTVRGKYGVKFT